MAPSSRSETGATGSLSDAAASAAAPAPVVVEGRAKNKIKTNKWAGLERAECPYCAFDAVGDGAVVKVEAHVSAEHPDKWLED